MTLRNLEGGELGADIYDSFNWPERPPGSPQIWLRVYSDQWRIYYNNDPEADYSLRIDARPYSGPDANKPFPLRADVQGLNPGQTISASNCKFVFQAQNGYGTGGGYRDVGLRDYYDWVLTLNTNYAQFTDGSHAKTGRFDLTQGRTFETPTFNVTNLPPGVSFVEFTLTPTGAVPSFTVTVISRYEPWFGTNTIGNPSGAGSYPAGTNVQVQVDQYVVNPTNAYQRVRFNGVVVTDQ
ncbi:MAG: hypothetical protein NZ483_09505 [Verrucomicrobiae bacterium]|nr:hypothetical protein [Verrucomicrobiae bacterium]MDW8342988.1 hypothetical protein [Verrucomicrobiae bacterium]